MLGFVLGALLSYLGYFIVRYKSYDAESVLNPPVVGEYPLCDTSCKVINKNYCREWMDFNQTNLCSYMCSTSLEIDNSEHTSSGHNMFTCLSMAVTPQDIINCGFACSPLDEI